MRVRNVGGLERGLRAVIGTIAVLLDFLATIQIELVLLVVGLWGVLTSAIGYCPFNGLLGRNTCVVNIEGNA